MPKIQNPVHPVHRCQKPPPTPIDKNISSLTPSPCRVRIFQSSPFISIPPLTSLPPQNGPLPVCHRSSPSKRPVAHGQSAIPVAPQATTLSAQLKPGESWSKARAPGPAPRVHTKDQKGKKATRKTSGRRAESDRKPWQTAPSIQSRQPDAPNPTTRRPYPTAQHRNPTPIPNPQSPIPKEAPKSHPSRPSMSNPRLPVSRI